MTLAEVNTVLAQAVSRAAVVSPASVVAVVDREGFVLGVWSVNGLAPTAANQANAIARPARRPSSAAGKTPSRRARRR